MNAIEQLKSVLCDPTGRCCIHGSDADRAIVDEALAALAATSTQPAPSKVTNEDIQLLNKISEQLEADGYFWQGAELRRFKNRIADTSTRPTSAVVHEIAAWMDDDGDLYGLNMQGEYGCGTIPLYRHPPTPGAVQQPDYDSLLRMREDHLLAAQIAEGYKPSECPPLTMPLAGILYAKLVVTPPPVAGDAKLLNFLSQRGNVVITSDDINNRWCVELLNGCDADGEQIVTVYEDVTLRIAIDAAMAAGGDTI